MLKFFIMGTNQKRQYISGSLTRLVIVFSVISFVFLVLIGNISNQYVKHSEQQRLEHLRQLIQIARNTIEPTLQEYRYGHISKKETINRIRDITRRMVFSEEHGSNYIFMSSFDGLMLVQPFEPEKEMLNQWNLKDSNGLYIIRGLVEIAKTSKNGGFFTYEYIPPGKEEPEEKVSYVLGIDEIDCYIGSGRYMGDLRKEQILFQMQVLLLEFFLMVLIASLLMVFLREIHAQNLKLSKEVEIRQLSEMNLLNEKIRLRTLIETIPDLIWLKDAKGIYLFCNPKFERFFGKTEQEIIGQSDYQFVDKDLADLFQKNDLLAIKKNLPNINEEEVVYADDGHKELLETIKTPMYDSEGVLIGVLGIARDITRRKQQEKELMQLHNYLINIIDSMPSYIIGIDEKGCVSRWNRKMEIYSGILLSEALNLPITSILSHLSMDLETIITAIEEKKVIDDQRRMRIKDKQIIYESFIIYPLLGEGENGAVVQIDDVTEKIQIEEMMIQSEKMLSIGGLAAGMAHEINNPLAGMIQTAEVMSNRLSNEMMPANISAAAESGTDMQSVRLYMEKRKILTMLQSIKESGSRAAKIIENMLSFSRQSDFSFSFHNPAELMEHVLELASSDYNVKKQYDFREIRIIRKYGENLPEVYCDSGKIQQVLINILKNGSQAMYSYNAECDAQGIAKIIPQFTIIIQHEIKEKMLHIEVTDNGPGMDDSVKKRLFEPFFTTKTIGLGTGLGLSVSYFIITENHKGTMSVDSQPGKGTTFIIRIPTNESDLENVN